LDKEKNENNQGEKEVMGRSRIKRMIRIRRRKISDSRKNNKNR
jgi:hypothetical protein